MISFICLLYEQITSEEQTEISGVLFVTLSGCCIVKSVDETGEFYNGKI